MKRLSIITLSFLLLSSVAFAGDLNLIRELETLRNSLPYKDVSRPKLTLRLADVYFDDAIEKSAAGDGTKSRNRAISLYEEALSGANGLFSTPNGLQKIKINFQLARLYSDAGQAGKAKSLFQQLVEQDESVEIKRESALRLAELLENEGTVSADEQSYKYYSLSIQLCGAADTCSYSKYRRSWISYRAHDLTAALKDMRTALLDSKGQVREEALRDLIMFMTHVAGDGKEQLIEVEELSAKITRPELLAQLSDGFYSVGNKIAGTNVLEHVNRKSPLLKNQIRLLEEYYGQRRWDDFRAIMDDLKPVTAANLPQDQKDSVNIEKLLRRLSIQLDGQRVTEKQYAPDFQNLVFLYLRLYPRNDLRSKMVDGWIASETNEKRKIDQLAVWISEEAAAGASAEETRLRKMRAAIAQKLGQQDTVIEESTALASKQAAGPEQRKFLYMQARALYEKKDYEGSLPLFQKLAVVSNTKPDEWAIKSQNLVMDILAVRKDYNGVISQADSWIKNSAVTAAASKDEALQKEVKEMSDVRKQTIFEQATAQGESPEALKTFMAFCTGKEFLPKSCQNAKILAVKLRDQTAVIQILKILEQTDDLNSELEAAGFFADAAAGLEKKLTNGSDIKESLKVALLYELGNKISERNRILESVWKKVSSHKTLGENEELLYITFKDAGMLTTVKALELSWNHDRRLRMAHDFEMSGKGNALTRKMVFDSPTEVGPAWAKMKLAIIQELDQKQRKVTFYGKGSKKKFNDRLTLISKLKKESESLLEGSSASTRVQIAKLLQSAYSDLAAEVLKTPLPEGLDEETVVGLKKALEELSAPYTTQAKGYEDLAAQQQAKVVANVDQIALSQGSSYSKELDLSSVKAAVAALHQDPNNREALTTLKNFYDSIGLQRLGSYFLGRINLLKS